MAFVFVQHLDPTHVSLLSETLARATAMPVSEAVQGALAEPNHVYVIPSNAMLMLRHGALRMGPRDGRRRATTVDSFFESLAADQGPRAVGIVLSGTGADGTEGLRAIKSAGGITFAQDAASARFSGMPDSADAAGVVDRRLPLERIAQELTALGQQRNTVGFTPEAGDPTADRDGLLRVVALLKSLTGADFLEYKLPTLRRRIARRMALRRVATFEAYEKILSDDPAEAKALAEDVLIHVTAFFRDTEAFDSLGNEVVPALVGRKQDGESIRVWVAGCSTGEEVYSLAMIVLDAIEASGKAITLQIFGSDLSGDAIERARAGTYTEDAVQGVGPERLRRHFLTIEGGYRIAKHVRDLCVFVKHDLTRDPPFARLDIISCRNVLIYFAPALQRKVVSLFHYCLNPGGILFVGKTETPAGSPELFRVLDKKYRVYVKQGTSPMPMLHPVASAEPGQKSMALAPAVPAQEIDHRVDRLLLERFAPPGVVVDERLEIIKFRGRTGTYLEPAAGAPSHGLLKMAREGLRPALRSAFQEAVQGGRVVRREGLRVANGDDGMVDVNLEVIPLLGGPTQARFFLVLFEEPEQVPRSSSKVAKVSKKGAGASEAGALREVERLKTEIVATREYVESMAEERQHLNEELTATNEELVTANEELQSTNEELETAKEELQSTNEEIITVNDELNGRNQELTGINSDLINLLASVDIPIVIVDAGLRLRRYTPKAKMLMNLIPADMGRPIGDLKPNILVPDFERRIADVLEDLSAREWEVQDKDGHWYRMHIRPYRTVDDRIDGAVVSLVDIDVLKHAVSDVESARDYMAGIVQMVSAPLVVLDGALKVLLANDAYCRVFDGKASEMVGGSFFEVSQGVWNEASLRRQIEKIVAGDDPFVEVRLEIGPPSSRRVVLASGTTLRWRSTEPMALLTLVDITDRARFESERAMLLETAERANQSKDLFLAMLSHELRTPLSAIVLQSEMLLRAKGTGANVQRAGEAILRAANAQAALVEDLLDVSRIVAGKLKLKLEDVDLAHVVRAAIDTVRAVADKKFIRIDVTVEDTLPVRGDPNRLQQVVWNLLANAVKFTPAKGVITVKVGPTESNACVEIADNGRGIDPQLLPHIFNRFVQADSTLTRLQGGLGLGLAIVHDLVRLHGGRVQAMSEGVGRGATFTITIPMIAARPQVETPAAESAAHEPETEGSRSSMPTESELQGVRVLVVEDDDETREALSGVLNSRGADVLAVARPDEVVAALGWFRPCILLCDIAMPEEDGYTLMRRLTRLGLEVPAVALTALATDADRDEAFRAQFERHLTKPIAADKVCHVLADVARRHDLFQATRSTSPSPSP